MAEAGWMVTLLNVGMLAFIDIGNFDCDNAEVRALFNAVLFVASRS